MPTTQSFEDSVIDNSRSQKINTAEFNYLEHYTLADLLYTEAIELLTFMGELSLDVDVLQRFF